MKNKLVILSIAMLILSACSKKVEQEDSNIFCKKENTHNYIEYTIFKGEQFCNKSIFAPVKTSDLSFKVRFDSSAIYTTTSSNNQADINKLYGFSDNNAAHHEYSARFGWRWSDNALRLFAYVYNNSVMNFKELGTIKIGEENDCSIKVSGNEYIFGLNGKETNIPRASTTPDAEGYKLFPYFGGNELAPHKISIWIEDLSE